MKSVDEVLAALRDCGSPGTVKIYRRHGAPENTFGCKVADMKTIARSIKGNQQLALDLYASGNADAMYLAGIVADGSQMNQRQLQQWARDANWYMISEYAVPGVACQHPAAWSLGSKWIRSKTPHVAACGWVTLAGVLATRPDDVLDQKAITALLKEIQASIHEQPNRVRYTMNGFVIAAGAYCSAVLATAKRVAKSIGPVQVEMGETSCKVPDATESIAKIEGMGRVGRKRKTVKC